MALTKEHELIHAKIKQALQETDVDTGGISNLNGVRAHIGEQHERFQQVIEDYVKDAADYIVKLKTHLNSLVSINRLPVELLTRIIKLAHPSWRERLRDLVSYTWVCHHWRSVLIQTAQLWTSIRLTFEDKPVNPFILEVLERSKSNELDFGISIHSTYFISMLEDLLVKESNRIQTLRVMAGNAAHLIELIFEGKCFPSLKRVAYQRFNARNFGLGLLPLIIASDHLEALQCDATVPTDVLSQLAPVLTRTPKLKLIITTAEALQFVLDVLNNNTNIRSLELETHQSTPFTSPGQTVLPELQYLSITEMHLLDHLRVPKLTSLDVRFDSRVACDNRIHDRFDLSSIKYLQVLGSYFSHTILGLMEPIHPKMRLKNADQETRFVENLDYIVGCNDICDPWLRGCLRMTFYNQTLCIQTLQEGFLSRFTGLLELCLAAKDFSTDEEFRIEKILAQVPSLETLNVLHGGSLVDFVRLLTDPSLCPRLSYISYTASYPCLLTPEKLENLAENVGKLLTESVQSRQKTNADGNALKYVALGKCPPLPEPWVQELQMLGTTIVTTETIEIIIIGMQEFEDFNSERSIIHHVY